MKQLTLNIKTFINSSSFAGALLILCVLVALVLANSPLEQSLNNLLSYKIGFETDFLNLDYSMLSWINDGLMSIFFLLVGLEIKRELVAGELSSLRKAMLPILAATGGALLPALIYFIFNRGTITQSGWGIPMATDIAFALAVIVALGSRVPNSAKIFMTALAIVDDLLAIFVVAFFYVTELHLTYLLFAFFIFLFMCLLNYFKCKFIFPYIFFGIILWYLIHHSGIHATISGVLTAVVIPVKNGSSKSPLERIERTLVKPVNLIIIPLFAFVNTAIHIESHVFENVFSSLGIGIALGLLLGKTFGIYGTYLITTKTGLCQSPKGATSYHMFGASILGGIGFTMAIFVSNLSFQDHLLIDTAKIVVLITSVTAAIVGYIFLGRIRNYNSED